MFWQEPLIPSRKMAFLQFATDEFGMKLLFEDSGDRVAGASDAGQAP